MESASPYGEPGDILLAHYGGKMELHLESVDVACGKTWWEWVLAVSAYHLTTR